MSVDLLTDLDEWFQPIVLEGIARAKARGVQLNIDSGLRTQKEQEALYKRFLAGGPRAAPPGQSAHEWGLAIDFSVLDHGTHRVYSGAQFEIARESFQKAGGHLLALELDDPGHVEFPNWRVRANQKGRQDLPLPQQAVSTAPGKISGGNRGAPRPAVSC